MSDAISLLSDDEDYCLRFQIKTYLRACAIKSRRSKRGFCHVNFSYGE